MSQPVAPSEFDPRAFRNALGQFATGVAIVTTRDRNGQPIGLTVNSFNSVSLTPPLVVWSLDGRSGHLDDFLQATHYGVNILARDQEAVSNTFASPVTDRFAGIDWQPGLGDVPVLAGCVATFEVRNTQQVRGGDHLVFIGTVERFAAAGGEPLLYHAGRYAQLQG